MSEPIPPGGSLSSGGMSREGATTVVGIGRPKVPLTDRLVLCPAICKCKNTPGQGIDGRSLKQACVSNALKGVDKAMDHKSPYKPEVNYDMTRTPPAPIMDSRVVTKGHDWLPGWIAKYWDQASGAGAQRPPFQSGEGMIRRPDVVIVNDPTKPPTQDNIKQVVEIKFPPDKLRPEQADDYAVIAGGHNKFAKLEPDDCTCDKPEPSPPTAPALEPSTVAGTLMLGLLALALAF